MKSQIRNLCLATIFGVTTAFAIPQSAQADQCLVTANKIYELGSALYGKAFGWAMADTYLKQCRGG